MKTIFIIGFFCLLLDISCNGQNLYSLENLQQSSPERLNTYLDLAKKQKKTGATIKIIGLLTVGAGVLVSSVSSHDEWIISTGEAIGGAMMLLGTGAILVGLPIQLTGAARIRRINGVKANSLVTINIDLVQFRFTNHLAKRSQSGVTLRLKF